MPPIKYIYKQSTQPVSLDSMSGLQWFALSKAYGTEYGFVNTIFKVKKQPRLIDIGNADIRVDIENKIKPENPNITIYSDPDEQYSGISSNQKYHNLVKKYYSDIYDGTIIDSTQLHGNEKYPVSELDGPSEIVLWHNFPDFLKIVETDKLLTTRRNTKRRKTVTRRTRSRTKH